MYNDMDINNDGAINVDEFIDFQFCFSRGWWVGGWAAETKQKATKQKSKDFHNIAPRM